MTTDKLDGLISKYIGNVSPCGIIIVKLCYFSLALNRQVIPTLRTAHIIATYIHIESLLSRIHTQMPLT